MKVKIMRFLLGYLCVQLRGFSPERFLNLCMARQIGIWDLRYEDKGYEFYLLAKDFPRLKPIVHKSGVRIRIVRKCGLPFFLHKNRKRKLYGAGALSFFLILFVMSQFVWNISFQGNLRFTDDTLMHYLRTQGVVYGVMKSRVDCDQLEESIRGNYPEIIWVSARISGTKLMIRIKENDGIGTIPVKDDSACDLVADQAGIITQMIVRKGKAQVRIGDTVEKGQVLVSGIIPIYNDAEELVNQQYVQADADIQVKTLIAEKEKISKWKEQRVYTGGMREGVRIQVGKSDVLLLLPSGKDTLWEYIFENRQVRILNDFYLPVWIDKIRALSYEKYERPYTKEELEQLKMQTNQKIVEKLREKGVQIIENNVKILDKSSYWEISGEYTVIQPIGTRQNIQQEEELTIPDEHN